ncbi:FtsB family cell division protein [Plantactinospora sp. CA-290183]|uniref:FtsB family cell division protein n=1 Tax=Plantactinospora sp. CA-290183 TaxID=3240006 RepID=UPI003D8A4793
MTQRRTPSGQGPARRPDRGGRAGAGAVRAGRPVARDASARVDQGSGAARAPRSGTTRSAGPVRTAGSARTAGSGRGTDGIRPASRPAAARRGTTGGTVRRTSAPQPRRYTGRVTVLIGVLVALALAYTYPVRVYLNQQSEIARIEAAQQAQTAHIGELTEKAELWKDPEFIKIQARERFYMVAPGEVPLVVLTDPEGAARDAGTGPQVVEQRAPEPWYDTLWSSVRAADEAEPVSR